MLMVMMMIMTCLGLAALQWSHEASKSTTGENEPTGDQDRVFPLQSCDQPERHQYKCGENVRILFHLVLTLNSLFMYRNCILLTHSYSHVGL